MDSVLRPRDIQARIRAGETPETVAAAAQTTVERIMAFATPVLAERAYVAQQAQRASLRPRRGDAAGNLGTVVAAQLSDRAVDPETDLTWDAWQRADGRWTLVADVPGDRGTDRAEFVYDAAGRYVTACDDVARRLVGEGATPDDSQLRLGDDAIEVVTGRRPDPTDDLFVGASGAGDVAPAAETADVEARGDDVAVPARGLSPVPDPAADESTVDLTEPAARLRAPAPVGADTDWMATQATERPAVVVTEPPEALFEVPAPVDPTVDTTADTPVESRVGTPDETAVDRPGVTGAEEAPRETAQPTDGEEPRPAPARRPARARGRAAIPTWDEIMLGSSRAD